VTNLYPAQVKILPYCIILLLCVVVLTASCTPTHRKFEICKQNLTIPVNCQNLRTKDYCVFLNGSIQWVDGGKLDFDIVFEKGPFDSDVIKSSSGETPPQTPIKSSDDPYKYTIKCKNNNVEDAMIRVP
jgi:hypothetical protein